MTTLKEYRAIDFISLKTAQGDIVSVHRDEIEIHLYSYKGYKVTELIRVIELAEEALTLTARHNTNDTDKNQLAVFKAAIDVLSEIRKLKGE